MSKREKAPPAPPVQLAKPQVSSRRGRKLAKRSAALALVATGLYAVMSESGFVASNNAVVSAYVISLRTPIDGIVDGGMSRVGTRVEPGAVLARIENPRAETRHLTDLQAREERIAGTLASLEQERAELMQLREMLEQRAAAHQEAVSARLQSHVLSAENLLAAKIAEQDHLRHELQRKSALGHSGTISTAEFETAQAAFDVATREVAELTADLAAAQVNAGAARRGVLSEPGAIDVAYSAQRMDELAIHLAEVAQSAAALTAEQAETARLLAAEEKRLALISMAAIVAPQEVMVWRLGVSPGERLGTGDLVAQLVDCHASFLAVAVPQDRLADIIVGSTASFRLAGETQERTGRVLSVTGDALVASDRHLAASPVEERAPTAFAVVEVDASDNVSGACLVGRTARVLLPSSGGGFVQRTLRRLPVLDETLNRIMASATTLRHGFAWVRNQFAWLPMVTAARPRDMAPGATPILGQRTGRMS